MPTVTNGTCVKQQGGSSYDAGCDVALAPGESFPTVYCKIYPQNSPEQSSEAYMTAQGGGHYASSWVNPVPQTQPPYKAKFRVAFMGSAESAEINVTS